MQKNVASQKWVVFAFDETDHTVKAGDAGNITGEISKDGAAGAAITDTNPTELEDGYYVFDISQAESNADYLLIMPESSTANIQVFGCPRALWTTAPYFNDMGIESDGHVHSDVKEIEGVDATDQIRDAVVDDATRIDASSVNAVEAKVDTVDGVADAILLDTGTDGVVLADDAITNDKYDENTAFPLEAAFDYASDPVTIADDAIKAATFDEATAYPLEDADSGNTQVARVGADGDTLETLSDQLDTIAVRKNVALSNFIFFMVDSTDHVTPETGKSITSQISKDGAAFAVCDQTATEIGSGFYKIDLIQAEMNYDIIALKFTASGCDQRSVILVTSG